MNWLAILELILKDAVDLIPLFIHDAKTGKVAAVMLVPVSEVQKLVLKGS